MSGGNHSNLCSQSRASARSPIAYPASIDYPARPIPRRISRSAERNKMVLCNPRRISSYRTARPQPPLESIDPRNRGVGVFRVSKQLPLLRLRRLSCRRTDARVDTARLQDIYEARPLPSGSCSAGLKPGILSPKGLAGMLMSFCDTKGMRDSSARGGPRNDNVLSFSATSLCAEVCVRGWEPQRLKPRKGAALMSELKLRPPKAYADPKRPKTCRADPLVPLGTGARRYI